MKLHHQATLAGLRWLLAPARQAPSYEPVSKRVLYVPASSLPYHISGYATRTHAVAGALSDAGADVRVFTRPGYPWDRPDRLEDAAGGQTRVGDLVYEHAQHPSKFRPLLLYAYQASRVIEKAAARKRVSLIIAPSNHTNALPALIAARRLSIPFFYEMRGLWELSRASRFPSFEGSPGFCQGLELEGFVAEHADRLLVISEQLRRYALKRWNLQDARVGLFPNCVDPERVLPADPAEAVPNSIGYAGSLIGYEGLDTLIEAVAVLAGRGKAVSVAIIGDGEAREGLEQLVGSLGLSGLISFRGRTSPEEARASIRKCALVCLPRKPFEVCTIVPPIKLVEALASGKPVIVSDLPVLRDELGEGACGWLFSAGDPVSLADAIEKAFTDHDALAAMGRRARERAVGRRNWHSYALSVLASLDELERERT